jgi:hypothetical protein
MKPTEFETSMYDFTKIIEGMYKEGLIDNVKIAGSQQLYVLTEKGEEKARSIESEIDVDDYISLITRVSPKVELRKRMLNIETLLISGVFIWVSIAGIGGLKNLTLLPAYIIFIILIFFLIVFVIGLIYLVSSLAQIMIFWIYYTANYGRTPRCIFNYYKKHERNIKFISKFILLPIFALLVAIYVLGWSIETALGTLFFTFIVEIMKSK